MQSIGIIGSGFAGIMTAIQLIRKAPAPLSIYIIGDKNSFARGVAYQPYSSRHILNVIAGKMSAFPDQPDHFLDWLMDKEEFKFMDRNIVSNSFISRKLYGDYLVHSWQNHLKIASEKGIEVVELTDTVSHLNLIDNQNIQLDFHHIPSIVIDQCVIATGNQIPKNPGIANIGFFKSKNYFQNPWSIESVKPTFGNLPILILGNGLTMVDTILGLEEQNYSGEIFSLSPNGFNILPHRHSGVVYKNHLEEIKPGMKPDELASIIFKHIRIVRKFGISAEPIIDALRPLTQKLWSHFTAEDKKHFMERWRHLFGVARHRIPLHIYDKIMRKRIEGKLHIQSGRIIDITEQAGIINVKYFNKKTKDVETIQVSRVINCTGPETDFSKLEDTFLSQVIHDKLISQDELKLGISANTENFRVRYPGGNEHINLFTLGSNLKGELWESTAVNELRQQAVSLAEVLLDNKKLATMQNS